MHRSTSSSSRPTPVSALPKASSSFSCRLPACVRIWDWEAGGFTTSTMRAVGGHPHRQPFRALSACDSQFHVGPWLAASFVCAAGEKGVARQHLRTPAGSLRWDSDTRSSRSPNPRTAGVREQWASALCPHRSHTALHHHAKSAGGRSFTTPIRFAGDYCVTRARRAARVIATIAPASSNATTQAIAASPISSMKRLLIQSVE